MAKPGPHEIEGRPRSKGQAVLHRRPPEVLASTAPLRPDAERVTRKRCLWGQPKREPRNSRRTADTSAETRSSDSCTREPAPLPNTLEDYLSLFDSATPEQRAGDYSTSYLVSHFAASRIAELQPDARIIAILREPASFLRSLHLQLLQNHVETEKDLRRAIAFEQDRREGRRLPRNEYWLEAPIFRARAICRAAAPLSRRVPTGAGAGAHLRRFPARQRGDRAQGAALPRRGRHVVPWR